MLMNPRLWPIARRALAAIAALVLLQPSPVLQASPEAVACVSGGLPIQARAASLFPNDGLLAWRAGRVLVQSGRTGEGLCFLERAHAVMSQAPDLEVEIGDARAAGGDLSGAIDSWQTAEKSGASPEEILPRLMQAVESRRDWSELATLLARWIALHPQDANARYRFALIEAARAPAAAVGDLHAVGSLHGSHSTEAETLADTITAALAQDGEVFALARVGEFLLRVGESALAESALQAAVDRNPEYGEALAYLGLAREQSGEPSGGEYAQAVELSPESAQAHLLYGSFLMRQGDIGKARLELEQAWALDPHSAAIAAERGRLEFAAGDLLSAETWYAQGVQLAPQSVDAWLARAAFYIGNQVRVSTDGIASAREAVTLAPHDPRALDLLGLAWYLEGDLPLAERMYWQALAADPGYALSYLHLGMLAESRKDPARARAFYQSALGSAGTGAVASLARAALERLP
jgi:tetratricopeptide (TPR) repeat protein